MSAADQALIRRDYVDSAGASIYYEEHGAGRPLILAPGWTFTTEVYQHQIAHFSTQYRTIAYDPRSHGRSSITLDGNTYMQHGRDLAALIDKLDLAHFVFIGWSAGCFDGYAYVRQYGPEKLDAFICIDQPPKTFVEHEGEWGLGNYPRWRDVVNGVQYTRVAAAERLATRLLTRELRPTEKEWLVRQSLTTPTFAAVNLLVDSAYADYRPEVQQLGETTPFLNILREDWEAVARQWIAHHTPKAKIYVRGNHMMFWEFPDEINGVIAAFLVENGLA